MPPALGFCCLFPNCNACNHPLIQLIDHVTVILFCRKNCIVAYSNKLIVSGFSYCIVADELNFESVSFHFFDVLIV